jgi:hypothetical protein
MVKLNSSRKDLETPIEVLEGPYFKLARPEMKNFVVRD